ncbi:MAG: hypothetical protein ACI8TP_003692 [Acidimicrobiales bacterium]|jgi:hypothetical protein
MWAGLLRWLARWERDQAMVVLGFLRLHERWWEAVRIVRYRIDYRGSGMCVALS